MTAASLEGCAYVLKVLATCKTVEHLDAAARLIQIFAKRFPFDTGSCDHIHRICWEMECEIRVSRERDRQMLVAQ